MSAACFHPGAMNGRTVERETSRRLRLLTLRIGEDVRRLRLDAGVTLRDVASATGLDASHIARIEKGLTHASLGSLTAIGVALGADLNARFYAGSGPRLHDRFQAPMIEALLRSLSRSWTARLEVPTPASTRGVADIILSARASRLLVIGEAQSELGRLEQQLRWIAEKAKAFEEAERGRLRVGRLLILRSTSTTRDLARRFDATLSTAYPARSANVFDALTEGSDWPGDGIVWMRVEAGMAELLRHPPRGVRVGR
jgi:transcriptional regulator with XRE-family HTH domain